MSVKTLPGNDKRPIERKKDALRNTVIRHLYLKGPRTVAEIGHKLQVSLPTTLQLLNDLSAEGIIAKQGRGESIGGRKPDLYGLQPRSFFVLAIDIDRHTTRLALFDNQNTQISDTLTIAFEASRDLTHLETITQPALQLIRQSGIVLKRWVGVGVSMTGLVSAQDGRNFTYAAEGHGASLKEELESIFHKPVFIENDVKSAALAEYRFGLAHETRDALVISLDWGLGLGIIMDGKLRRGAHGFAGEFGHIPLMEYGPLCSCGKTGCLETVASGLALSRDALQGLKSGQRTLLRERFRPEADRIPLEAIIQAALEGDQFSIQLMADTGRHLGKGVATLIQLFNPSLIVLSGVVAQAGPYITLPLQQAIQTHSMRQLNQLTRIELSQLGNDARLLGAVASVMENKFNT